MKALFAYDHRYARRGEAFYSENHFDAAFWDRYLAHFDRLTVLGREGAAPEDPAGQGWHLSSRPEVDFRFVPNLSNAMGLTVRKFTSSALFDRLVADHDAVIARLPSEIGLAAISAARRMNVPAAIEVVGCAYDALAHYGNMSGRIYAPIAYRRMKSAIRASDNAIYVTDRFLQSRYPAPDAEVAVASNVVLPPHDDGVLDRRLLRMSDGDGVHVRLGLIGSLVMRQKGIQTVIAALAEIRRRSKPDLPGFSFHVLGGGDAEPWREEADRAGVGDIVHFEGTRPSGDPVLQWLDDIDIYLQPSFQEGLPRALIEAMSRGCPAIATSIAGIPELLGPDELIDPGDVRRLAALLERRLGDQEWKRAQARRNFEFAQRFEKIKLDKSLSAFWSGFAHRSAAQRNAL